MKVCVACDGDGGFDWLDMRGMSSRGIRRKK